MSKGCQLLGATFSIPRSFLLLLVLGACLSVGSFSLRLSRLVKVSHLLPMEDKKAEGHEKHDVTNNRQILQSLAPRVRAEMPVLVSCTLVSDDAVVPEPSADGVLFKKVHFIRHGEGYHNVAQREWKSSPSYDGTSEPYTIDNDPEFGYLDPLLTSKGEMEARALQERAAAISPQVLVVSPMQRATQTGLIAFAGQIEAGSLPVLATDLCHEMAGRHTCDKRLSKSDLAKAYPVVDYSLIAEDDPYWNDTEREPWPVIAQRAAQFILWLRDRPEIHLAVAAHSAILLTTFNAVLEADSEETSTWFGTGEMRTVMLAFRPKGGGEEPAATTAESSS